MTEIRRSGLVGIGAVIAVGLTMSTSAVQGASMIGDDFNDGNADGWSFDWAFNPGNVSFHGEPGRGMFLRMSWAVAGVDALYLSNDSFSSSTTNMVVEFDVRATTQGGSGGGSNHIQTDLIYDANNYLHDTIRWGAYNDTYSRHRVGGGHTPHNAGALPVNRETWTHLKYEWNEDVHTLSYTEQFDASGDFDPNTLAQWYSHDHGNGPIPLGAAFRYYLGGTSDAATFDLDNISVTPEPATLSLLAFGGLALLRRRRA